MRAPFVAAAVFVAFAVEPFVAIAAAIDLKTTTAERAGSAENGCDSVGSTAAELIVAPIARADRPEDSGQPQEVITEVRVHGNVATSDDDVRRLAGVEIGARFEPDLLEVVAARLRETHRFVRVDVLKRFASISDPTQIVIVIIVDEGTVTLERTGDVAHPTRVVSRHGPGLMFLPVLTAEDGYGLIYGAKLGLPDVMGKASRLSIPLTWGGDKRVGVELQKDLNGGQTRVSAGTSFNRRTHPFFEEDEDRGRVWARGEREVARAVHVGATVGWQHVSFLDSVDSFAHVGGDIVLDTRLDPMLARNAVYARIAWEHLALGSNNANSRTELEGRGYIGLFGQTVLVLRAMRDDASRPLPVYLQPMLGGLANVRGFRAGTAIGDTLVAGSAELRVPLTSPLNIAKLGVSAFVDAGSVYDKGQRFADQSLWKGVGGSVWISAAFVRFNVAVAHGIGSGTRVHVGGGLSF